MSATNVELWIFSRATHDQSIEQRHAEFVNSAKYIGPPLGFEGVELPLTPDCGDKLSAEFGVKYAIRGLKFFGMYIFRGERYVFRDETKFDDFLRFSFKTSNKALDYRGVLHEHFPKEIEAFRGYRAFINFEGYLSAYYGGFHPSESGFGADGYLLENNADYNRLREDKSIDIDGRNNIYTLRPAQYWDAELCRRALGYGPDEVIARLQGCVPRVEQLMDGVYLVLNDDPNLSYEDFFEMNKRYKSILGLI